MRPEKTWSLRRRMLSMTAVAAVIAWLCGGVAILFVAKEEGERMCHENLYFLATTVLRFAEHELREVAQDGVAVGEHGVHHETELTLGERYAYQIWSRDGRLLLRSVRAPADRRVAPPGNAGLGQTLVDGVERDVFSLVTPSRDMTIEVVDLTGGGTALSRRFMLLASLSFLLSFVPLVLGSWWLTNKAFGAVRDGTRQLKGRGARDLAPVEVADPPRELTPFLDAMNGLLGQMRRAIEREREFTSLAAHELRTPLAAIRVQAQVLARTHDERERAERTHALLQSVDRCASLSTQLLHLTRADAMAGGLDGIEPVRLDEACAEVLADFVDDASRRHIEVGCDLAAERVVADRLALQTLLRNLVSNAMRHTPDAGVIRIAVDDDASGTVLRVDDSGAGIPEAERERVFERFYRARGSTGVGLGLSIVSSIVEAHRAVIALGRSPLGGLRVEVRFPRAAAA